MAYEEDQMGLDEVDDDSGVSISVGVDRDRGAVVVQFSRGITWISFGYNDAIDFASAFLEKISILDRIKEGLTVGQEE